MIARRLMLVGTLLFVLLATTGCASSRGPSYARAYNAGRYSTAFREATESAASTTGKSREEAALIAGLAAHALNDDASAIDWLTPLQRSTDRSISGRAAAGLGLIAQERGDQERAAALLSEASLNLTGEDAAQAALHAGDAFDALGQKDAARRQYQLGYTQATTATLQATLTNRLNDQRWTIQLGAFANRRNAERAAHDFRAETAGVGLGSPRVVQSLEGGRRLYVVQVGEFRSQTEADTARQRLGISAIVAVADD